MIVDSIKMPQSIWIGKQLRICELVLFLLMSGKLLVSILHLPLKRLNHLVYQGPATVLMIEKDIVMQVEKVLKAEKVVEVVGQKIKENLTVQPQQRDLEEVNLLTFFKN